MHRWAGVCRGARARIKVKKQDATAYTSCLPTTLPPSQWLWWLVFGTVITVQLGSEASGPLGVATRATPDGVDSVQHPYHLDLSAQYCTRELQYLDLGGPYDDPVGSRQSTFFSCSHLLSACSLSIQATACWDIIAPTQYCSSAGHVPTCLPPRGRAWFLGAGQKSVGPTVGSHKTPTRPPSQVLALPFIPLLSSQQKATKPTEGDLTSWTSVRA